MRRHGTLTFDILGEAASWKTWARLRRRLYEREVRYLVANEWVIEADDILWRRTKAGLHMSQAQRRDFAGFMAAEFGLEIKQCTA